ncbi:DUF2637 domain-containing protein [Pseudonocardia sp. ICBG601]|uniref:DUF2637 domain-containing protein n=1 Tax=Pseudonocardia sp. ICBG601 TaxID=2846759 RepID=UPI0027E2EC87|nr:DUF2637 domain-containing protein [Pseudonocardia sp. ICBG601]
MTVHELRPMSGIGEGGESSVGERWARREQQPISEESPPQSGRVRPGLWASVWPRVLAVLVVGSVGLPAAVASYWHLQEVAARFNPGSALAYWLPLSVDGLLAAALVVVWSRRTRGERVGFGPWAAFAFGMFVTLLANAASVVPESEWARTGSHLASVAAWMVALFPPVAFAISLELIAIVLRPTRAAARAATRTVAAAAPRWTAPSGRAGHASPDGDGAVAASGGERAEGSQASAAAALPVQPVDPADDDPSAGGQGDTAPLPVVTPVPVRRAGSAETDGCGDGVGVGVGVGVGQRTGVGVEIAAGETKQAKAEALFVAAWTRGEDLSLSEVDRMIGGNRTAAKAKRSLRDRGMLPPAEHGLPAPRAGASGGAAARSGRVDARMVPA